MSVKNSCLNRTSIAVMSLLLINPNAPATQYVVPGGAGDGTGNSWENAWSDIQAALDEASTQQDEEVWVAAGRYELAAPLSLHDNSVLLGGFSGVETSVMERDWDTNITVLDGMDTTRVVEMIAIDGARLDGFVITRGKSVEAPDFGGGGILVDTSSNCEIANCKVLYNRSTRIEPRNSCEGGGIFLKSAHSCMVENSLFSGNSAQHYGASISSIYSTNTIISKCRFIGGNDNSAVGITRLKNNNNFTMVNCLVSGVTASYGCFVYSSQSLNAINCTIACTENRWSGGSAIHLLSQPILRNNILAYNRVNGIKETNNNTKPTVENNLFYGQELADYYDFMQARYLTGAEAINSELTWQKGSGNVDGDPCFYRFPLTDDGAWTEVMEYDPDRAQTTLVDLNHRFRPGTLKGLCLNPNTGETLYRHAEIASNTEHTITVWGDISLYNAIAGSQYRIYDYRLRPDSAAIDAAKVTDAPDHDILGNPRPIMRGYDIGAFEAQLPEGTLMLIQ